MSTRPSPEVPAHVFITGANGFIGRALATRLRELGAQVSGVDLITAPEDGIVAGSVADPQPWADRLQGVDAVVHMAAIVSMVASYDSAWQVNVMGTHRVFEAARDAGVGRFVHVSSVATYSHDFPDGVDEGYPVRVTGRSTYGDTKVNAEAVLLADAGGDDVSTEVVIVRPGDVYGPGSVWIKEPLTMIRAGMMVLPDGGRGMFHPVYIDDLVDGLILALSAPQARGQIFNIADEAPVTCRDYFGRIATWIDGDVRTAPAAILTPTMRILGSVQRRVGMKTEVGAATADFLNRPGGYSITKARTMLGYAPRVDLDEGMRRSKQWAQDEGLLT